MIALVAGLFMVGATASAETLFSDGFDSGDNWTVQATDDAAATFGFDYSAMGIPPSPNGGGTTLGLKMTANETAGASNEINAVPTGLDVTGQYVVQFDFWANANGPFPGGGGGSTEFIGGGVGLNGGDPGRDGASLMITGEGGSSRDWRLYKNTGEQFVESLQYSDFINDDANTNNNANGVLSGAFPGQEAPQGQKDNYPQQTGAAADGTVAFGWHTMQIQVNPDGVGQGTVEATGTATFLVDGLAIGTIDNSNGGDVVDMTGGVGVIYADLFSSLSDNPELSFGLFDNFVVTQVPEPGGVLLLLLGSLTLLGYRRRIR